MKYRTLHMKHFLLFTLVIIGFIILSCDISLNGQNHSSLSLEVSILDSSGKHVDTFSKYDTVSFLLSIQNISDESIAVTYCSSQEYDFYMHMGNDVVWKWSNNKAFLTVMIYDTIAPGEIIEFTEKWPDEQVNNIRTGNYILVGEHTGVYTGIKMKSFKFSIAD